MIPKENKIMEQLRVGFSKCEITPKLGSYLQGHNKLRYAVRVNDPLFVRCVIFENQGMAVMLCYDLCGMNTKLSEEIRKMVASYVGCEPKDVFVSCTHTHTGPNVVNMTHDWDQEYVDVLKHLSMHAAALAKNDLRSAQMSIAQDELKGVSFCRRYRMKDGSVRTNPGVGNPDIAAPMNDPDYMVQLLKITREGANDIAMVNFGCHADSVKMINDEYVVSADWPGVACNAVEGALPGVSCVVFNGPCGDVAQRNHMAPPDTVKSTSGWPRTVLLGRSVAGKVISLYNDFTKPLEAGPVATSEIRFDIPLKRPTEEQLAAARDILEHEADYLGGNMQKTTTLFEARMLLTVSKTNGFAPAIVSAFRVGQFGAAGIPGEPFCEIGKQIKEKSPYEAQFVLYLTNGSGGYFPMKDAFSYDGYEARTAKFQPGVGELMIDNALELLNEMNQ